MLLDVFAWFVTKYIPSFAYVVIGAGALMGLSMGAQILVSLYQMWFYRVHPTQRSKSVPQRAAYCKHILGELGYGLDEAGPGWLLVNPIGKTSYLGSIGEVESTVRKLELEHQGTA